MSHPNSLVNGCSLEDCYTNLFALTDLCGIKWRKYSTESNHVVEPLDDPVLLSFSRCTQTDILCSWKKVQKSSVDLRGNDQYSYGKELWLFWYGGEPSNLPDLLSPELTEAEQGSWDNGLSYECRTLLFKALHNLIERYLLQRNFVRLGKWFVQPYDTYDNSLAGISTEKGPHLSISFSFFLHGESTVCSSIDVRQHPPVRALTMKHVTMAQEVTNGVQVILAPHGLTGVLTGQTCKDSDSAVQKLLEEWRQFYVMESLEKLDIPNDLKVPSMVEVVVGGIHMKYPSRFILVTDCDQPQPSHPPGVNLTPMPSANPLMSQISTVSLTPPTSPCDAVAAAEANINLVRTSLYAQGSVDPGGGPPVDNNMMECLVEKVWEDGCVSAGMKRTQTLDGSGDEAGMIGNWDFGEPIQKGHCGCSKLKSKNRSALSAQNKEKALSSNSKYMKLDKLEKSEKTQSKHSRTPFHRRFENSEDVIHNADVDYVMQKVPMAPLSNFKGPMSQGNASLPSLRTTNFDQGVDSPNSAAPSPLVASHSQPAITQSASDPTMPTLSPHPPVKIEKDLLSHTGNVQPESQMNGVGINDTNNPVTGGTCAQVSADVYVKPPGSVPKAEPFVSYQPNGELKPEVVSNWLDNPKQEIMTCHPGLKRPELPASSYEEDEQLLGKSLYDFSSLNAWLARPVKRARSDHRTDGRSNSSGSRSMSNHSTPSPITSSMPLHDPYEFSDESSTNATVFCSRGFRSSREDSFSGGRHIKQEEDGKDHRRSSDGPFGFKEERASGEMDSVSDPQTPGPQAPPTSLMSEKDLVPTITDLDRLFDTSDEEDNDDTEPMTNGVGKTCDDSVIKGSKGSSLNSSTGAGIIGTTELSRMFPTPPSMENNTSPCNGPDPAHEMDPVGMLLEHVASPEAPDKECLLYVHKPSSCGQFLSSSKYSPIELPSSKLPPVNLPVNCYYKPSWQFQMPMMDKHQQQSQYNNLQTMENISNMSRIPTERLVSIPSSPATFQGSMQQRTPMSYELQSPASNASSYMNKNLSSIDNHGTNSQAPEAHSLMVNVVLSDSILNLFKDHNFDSCNICVCNMSIKGADIGVYIPESLMSQEPQYKCACGFSAVMNRKYGHNSGLFYEDELEITGVRDDRFDRHKPSLLLTNNQKDPKCVDREIVPHSILQLLQGQFACPFPTSTVLHHTRKLKVLSSQANTNTVTNMLEVQDACETCMSALEQGKQVMDNFSSTKLDEPHHKSVCLHKWPFLQAKAPSNSQDLVRLLKSLQPLLQDAIQKKRTTRLWESTYTITGPLTWKDFHKLAGRGSDEACEPQPIPALLVGYDKDWLSLAPHAVRYWEKLLLEPYSKARDVAFVVVAPENEFIHNNIKTFFKELSTVYELCRLGRHCPIPKLKDGIMRVGKKYGLSKGPDSEVSEWFANVGHSLVAAKLRMYAQVCRHHLAPYLADQPLDKALFENHGNKPMSRPQPQPQPSPSPHTPMGDGQGSVPTPQSTHGDDKDESTGQEKGPILQEPEPDEDGEIPTIVVYMVDPFTYGNEWEELSRLSTLGMLRCYQEMVECLPESMRDHVKLQVVPLQTIMDYNGEMRQLQLLKSMAFSVYTQCTQTLHHSYRGRSLTGFGPAASAEAYLQVREADRGGPTRLFSPPFIIAAQKDHKTHLIDSNEVKERCGLLLVSYCLSEDQKWLLATVTDERGERLESTTINIEIPNRNQRKKASARKIGLQKLWDFICGVISMTSFPWRIIVCRFGRLGHGELKGWANLLSRKNLLRVCKQFRDTCGLCCSLSTNDVPSILSACLISMEAQPTFRIVPDVVKEEEVQSSSCPLSTPKDATVTHILVFPTSATAAANAAPLQQESHMDIGPGMDDDDDLFSNLKEDLNMNIDQDINSFLSLADSPVPSPGSPGRGGYASPTSPGLGLGGGAPMFSLGKSASPQDESPNLLHQPLAMGYYVTTAKTGPLPKWFWSSCPHAEDITPTCLKFALHVHCPAVQHNQDDLFHASHNKNTHSLDSNFTCDVLRYVLEEYNSLSWLTFDVATNDRRSALPINFMVLMQLYHALNAFL